MWSMGELRVSRTVGEGVQVLHWQIGLNERGPKEPNSDDRSTLQAKYFMIQEG